MISAREIVSSLYGTYRLARLDTGGLKFFNNTREGFWHSFAAPAAMAPLFAILRYARADEGESADLLGDLPVRLIAYVILCVAFPVVMATLVRFMDRQDRYIPFIVAWNWITVLQSLLYITVSFVVLLPGGATEGSIMIIFMTILLVIGYSWFVTRAVLDISGQAAAGIIVLDIFIGVMIDSYADKLLL